MFAHLRFALAVLAARLPGAKSILPDPGMMVLQSADLAPGWQQKGRRTFRTGLMAPTAPWAQRLREMHGTSVVVSYQAIDDPWSMVVSQAFPFADGADAAAAFPTMEQRFLANPDLLVAETHRAPLDLATPLGDQCKALLLESTNFREPGSRGSQLIALWRHDSVLAYLAVGGRAARFNADDLVTLALRQDRRIGEALASAEPSKVGGAP